MATRAAAEIREALGIETTLIEGSKGIFDVKVDGSMVYSKYATDRHARPGELVPLIRAALQDKPAAS
jgi:hypothetical protein